MMQVLGVAGNPEQNTQIDLVIERADHNINLCEMKFSSGMYAIDKGYEQKLRERMSDFPGRNHDPMQHPHHHGYHLWSIAEQTFRHCK